jgi:hyperosmotically inducible periplasmic protein
MKQHSKAALWAPGLALITIIGVTGCQDKNNNGLPESPATSTQIEKAVDNAGAAVEKTVDKAVPAIEKAVEKGASVATDAAITGKVKAALVADKTISASEIDVDTKNKVVHLRGSVQNNAQRNLAGMIARKNAPGHTVKNELKVTGKTPAKKQ